MKRTILIAITIMALVFGLVAYAVALDDSTVVNANVNTILELTSPASVSLGALNPDVPVSSAAFAITGKSNKAATLSASVDPGTFTSLDCDLETAVGGLRGGSISQDDVVTGMVDYSVDGGTAVSGTITYSLVQ